MRPKDRDATRYDPPLPGNPGGAVDLGSLQWPSESAPTTLPLRFDTTVVWRRILLGVFALQAGVILPGLAYAILGRHDGVAALGLGLVGALLLYFTVRAYPLMESGVGVISADGVVTRRGRVLGLRLPGAEGQFALSKFRTIRVEEASEPMLPAQGGPSECVYLVGREGTPDLLIARTQDRRGGEWGEALGRLLGLPCERGPATN